MANLKITQVRSVIGRNKHQRGVMLGLGLKKMHQTVVRPDTPIIRGMITKVNHLVDVAETEEVPTPSARSRANRNNA